MTDNSKKAAFVTGGTSGLGFEAAAQLAEAGYGLVTITGRTHSRAEAARLELVERVGKDVFDAVPLDLNSPKSVMAAAEEFAARGGKVDLLLLNAGMVPGNELVRTDEGIEISSASSLVGHHQLTMQLLEDAMLSDRVRIVIAGSEAARGDVPTFVPTDLPSFAIEHYDGDRASAAAALLRYDAPLKYKPATAYANAKLFVAYWAQQLARKLPTGMTVNVVSPGSAPDTDAGRNANFFMKYLMIPVFKVMPGMSHKVADGAKRYIDAAGYPEQVNGEFFASPPKKMIGDLTRVELEHVKDGESAAATWTAIVSVSGGVDYPIAA